MPQPAQTVLPRTLQEAYRRELAALQASNAVARVWSRDAALWPRPADPKKSAELTLNWLDLPAQMSEYMRRVAKCAEVLDSGRFDALVLVAMGASNLAAHAVAELSAAKRVKRFLVLDSTDPAAILRIEQEVDLRRAFFVIANKTGKLIELHALLLYLLDRLRVLGVAKPGQQFIALTDENSYLAEMGKGYRFHDVFFDPPGISGRYSSPIHFDLLLSAIGGVEIAQLEARARAVREACGAAIAPETNPAAQLGAFLAAAAQSPSSRLFLSAPSESGAFLRCVAYVVGTSTGKERQGVVPLFADLGERDDFPFGDAAAVIFSLRGEAEPSFERARALAAKHNLPSVEIKLDGVESFGAELLKWNLATVLACSLLEVNPFDEPDVFRGRQSAQHLLENLASQESVRFPTVRVSEGGIELRAESNTRQQISTLSLAEALRTFLDLRSSKGYIALLGFLDTSDEVWASLQCLRKQLEAQTGIPVQPAFGPRYLHYLGQTLKGGPPNGLFVILTAAAERDVAVPGAGYTFGQMQRALALGDFEALYRNGERVIWLDFGQGLSAGLPQLEQSLAASLAHLRNTA
ncbi:MAG TPA: hypothetical protein VJP87_03175 [Candidatus Acidoferrales bacterium]|nr:hypothetical protein [Candidatus Acidoferrales bacterium]